MEISQELINKIGNFFEEHKCAEVCFLDIREKSSLADYVLLATVSSSGHLRGVLKHLYAFLAENGITPRVMQKKIQQENWIFLDCHFLLFHIMNKEAREYYQLENLWFDAKVVYSS